MGRMEIEDLVGWVWGGAGVISAVSSRSGPPCLGARLERRSCAAEMEGEETPSRMEEARPEDWPVAQV